MGWLWGDYGAATGYGGAPAKLIRMVLGATAKLIPMVWGAPAKLIPMVWGAPARPQNVYSK